MADITRTFEFEKETKNTMRFTEKTAAGEPPVIGTLYLQKWAAGDAKTLEVTVKVGNGKPASAAKGK